MSYIDAYWDRNKDTIHVVERQNGNRIHKQFPADYTFYVSDEKGKFQTVFGTRVSKISPRSYKDFQKELRIHSGQRTWESDIKPVFKCLEKNYLGSPSPQLNVAFFDIEVDFDEKRGFSKPEDPFNAITAISVYLNWCDQLITLAVPPKNLSLAQKEEIAQKYENCFLFDREADMLDTFLNVIEDADVLSGWNSEGYDIPYTVNRVARILSKNDTRRFCLWDKEPKARTFERHGKSAETYDLAGRVHLDYMQLYINFTYEERHSYSLDAISEHELGERKVEYEGTLDQLYNEDFDTFIDYNRQDTMLLHKLDQKLKFLELANDIAHDNTVLLPTIMGAVAVTEQAIINEAHSRGLVIQDRPLQTEDHGPAAGAYVAYPKKGMHKDIGAIDINSLYPSCIRALNMGPETIVGQVRPVLTREYLDKKIQEGSSPTAAWEGVFASLEYSKIMDQDPGTNLIVDWENGSSDTLSAAQLYEIIFNSNMPWCISANGTIFKYDQKAVIPGLLERWYSERKVLQKNKERWKRLESGIDLGDFFTATVPDFVSEETADQIDINRLFECLEQKNLEEFINLSNQFNLLVEKNTLKHKNFSYVKKQVAYWDKLQLVKKINLNSLYGAILNAGCRFYDHRIGQSTTLTGRSITKHMTEVINECLDGKRDHLGRSIIYNDTDSAYFSIWPIIKSDVESGKLKWDRDTCVKLYDSVADTVNDSFPEFMKKSFHVPLANGSIIRGGRELIASSGIFITKKRYGVLIYDLEGERLDQLDAITAKKKGMIPGEGKLKAMGLDLKRSDTPKPVQELLWLLLEDVLLGHDQSHIKDKIQDFKTKFMNKNAWEKGTPKRVNNLTKFGALEERLGKANMPGHVRAAINWNTLKRMHSDNHSITIVDGMKTIMCKLKPNPMGFTCVAYPIDQTQLPNWFKELPFDDGLMEETIVDQKIQNLLGVLKWDLKSMTDTSSTFGNLFAFE